jgi:hypothetical protein
MLQTPSQLRWGFSFLVPKRIQMAKKLSPQEATVMIIRRRLQQVQAAKSSAQSRTEKQPEAHKPSAAPMKKG